VDGVITGSHMMVYSRNAKADRALFRDVLQFPYVEVDPTSDADANINPNGDADVDPDVTADTDGDADRDGWLIFKLPPAEVGVHPTDGEESQEMYLMCDDLDAAIDWLAEKGVTCTAVTDAGWGLLTAIRLPGGGELGLYQPRHERATDL
jgi:catechol 2,3-dioxygenase-like lactoylglutathione lyase family enzyme